MGFSVNWVKFLMSCVSSVSYSYLVNGQLSGTVFPHWDLRQGDPISPYLFTLAMEVFSKLLRQMALRKEFDWHPRYAQLNLSHLNFTDDLFVFIKGDVKSARAISRALHYFNSISGLQPNRGKSLVFCAGCEDSLRRDIISSLGFSEGTLPITYLGIPLIASNLRAIHCSQLIQKVDRAILSYHLLAAYNS